MKFQNVIKLTYFCFVFRLFLAKNHSKKIWKQHISTKLDTGFRLVYKLSCQVEKKISTFFWLKWTKSLARAKNLGKNGPKFIFNQIWQFILNYWCWIILFLKIRSILEILHDFGNLREFKGFRLVYLVEDKFWSILAYKGDPYQKKVETFFSSR